MADVKRIVSTGFWTDRKTEDHSPEDKLFMLWLLTNPATTQLGIYEISIKQAANELGYSKDTIKVLLDRFNRVYGIIFWNEETGEVAVKNYLRHSIVKGGKPVEDCLWKDIKGVSDKSLVLRVFKHLQKYDDLNETVLKVISIYLNDNDNENDNDNDNDDSYHESSDESSGTNNGENVRITLDYEAVRELYNTICKSFPKCTKLSEARKKAIRGRFSAGYSMEDFKTLFEKAEKSDFLTGRSGAWSACFDWLIKDANMAKVLDGNYDNHKGGGQHGIPARVVGSGPAIGREF